jgi:hypothetical protein
MEYYTLLFETNLENGLKGYRCFTSPVDNILVEAWDPSLEIPISLVYSSKRYTYEMALVYKDAQGVPLMLSAFYNEFIYYYESTNSIQ